MQKANWYANSYRRNLVDMHIDDWDESFLSKLDPKVYVGQLKTARVKSAMVYANSHIGLCYWPTRSGQMHRGINGRDVLGEIVRLCHQEGIDVVAYYSLIFNNWVYEHHPSWRILYDGGTASRDIPPLGRYGVVCPNNGEYREFVDRQVKEVCAGYPLEGIFFDMTFWPGVCFCPACRERYAREVGEMPSTVNWQDPQWVAFQKRREAWLLDFAAFATGTAKKYAPGISVEHNSAPLTQPWFLGTTIGLREHNDYIGGDLYGGFAEQSFVCKLYHSITPNQPFEFMTSRCYPNLRDHTTMKRKDMLEVHAYLAMAHNGAFFFIDAIDPVGTMNRKVYETMGQVFERSQEYEPHLGGELCQDVAIYFSLDSKMDPEDNGKPANLAGNKVPHLDAVLGAARTLREMHIPFGVISRNNLKDAAARHKVIVLPEVLVLSEEEADALRAFVEQGGGLYASGRTDLTHLADVFGVSTEGETAETVTYITPTPRGHELLGGVDPLYPLSVAGPSTSLGGSSMAGAVGNGRQVKAEAASPDDVMATLTLPYTDPSDSHKIASIHSNPPGAATDYASVVSRRFGKGRAIWVAAPIEMAVQQPHKDAFAQMVRTLAGGPFSFEVDAPPAVEMTLFHQAERKRYLLNLVNVQELLPPVPVRDVVVRVRLEGRRPVRAALLPADDALPFQVRGDCVEIVVPRLEIFQMACVDYE